MSNINDIINHLKDININYNNEMSSLFNGLQDEINSIINKSQIELINKISEDYNINSKDLIRKYITKTKKTKKNKDEDSPTLQSIKEAELIVEPVKLDEIVYKSVKIKDKTFLLNPVTNELFDLDNNLVGKKHNSKYLLKK
jgi:arginine deiminase